MKEISDLGSNLNSNDSIYICNLFNMKIWTIVHEKNDNFNVDENIHFLFYNSNYA